MGSIQKRDKHRWKARYRGPDGRERSKMFTTEREAKDWLASRTVDLRRGDWTDPKLAQVTVGAWGAVWLERKTVRLKPSTIASYESLFRSLILPDWGTSASETSRSTTSTAGLPGCRTGSVRRRFGRLTRS